MTRREFERLDALDRWKYVERLEAETRRLWLALDGANREIDWLTEANERFRAELGLPRG
jgi:hypothetical protein